MASLAIPGLCEAVRKSLSYSLVKSVLLQALQLSTL